MEENQKNIITKLYTIRSVFIQVHFTASKHLVIDAVRYCEHGIFEINSLIEIITNEKASNKRWQNLDETFELDENVIKKLTE